MISPLYGQLSPLRIPTRAPRVLSEDADANAYLLAVEAADGEELEAGVITAVETFVLGCKSDGIWSAIKASCILAGARTLSGALVPLVGTAPTNNNFVSADYDRETGLKGNGLAKFLNSNRKDNADPQNSKHASVFVKTASYRCYMGALSATPITGTQIFSDNGGFLRANSSASFSPGTFSNVTGLVGVGRSSSTHLSYRINGLTNVVSNASALSPDLNIHFFKRNWINDNAPTAAAFSFYSIGESIDLALLDSRVSTLMTDLAAAIP